MPVINIANQPLRNVLRGKIFRKTAGLGEQMNIHSIDCSPVAG